MNSLSISSIYMLSTEQYNIRYRMLNLILRVYLQTYMCKLTILAMSGPGRIEENAKLGGTVASKTWLGKGISCWSIACAEPRHRVDIYMPTYAVYSS